MPKEGVVQSDVCYREVRAGAGSGSRGTFRGQVSLFLTLLSPEESHALGLHTDANADGVTEMHYA